MPIAWRPGTEFLAQDTLRLQPLIQGCVARPRNSRKNDRHFTGRIRTSLIMPSDAPGMESGEETGLAGCWDLGSNRTSRWRRATACAIDHRMATTSDNASKITKCGWSSR